MSDSFALIPKTITGSWGSEWECCKGITTRQDWSLGQRKPGCDRLFRLGQPDSSLLPISRRVSLCVPPSRTGHWERGTLMVLWKGQQRRISKSRRGTSITDYKASFYQAWLSNLPQTASHPLRNHFVLFEVNKHHWETACGSKGHMLMGQLEPGYWNSITFIQVIS